MLRAFEGKNDPAFWTKAAKGELMDEDWKEFMRYVLCIALMEIK